MACAAPLDAVGSPRSGSKAHVAKLCVLMITVLRIAANFYWGYPVDMYGSLNVGLLQDWNCPCDDHCTNPNLDPGGAWCNYSAYMYDLPAGDYSGCDEVNVTWGYCWNPPFDPDRAFLSKAQALRLNELRTPELHSYIYLRTFYAYEIRIDFMALINYVVKPLVSALGIYIFLSRPERSSAQSQLHLWCYRSVVWIFVSSLLADESIGGFQLEVSEYRMWVSGPTQTQLFVLGITLSNLLQMHIANSKLRCLLWNRLAIFVTFLAAALVLAGVGSTVIHMDFELGRCHGNSVSDDGCEAQHQFFWNWFLAWATLMALLGPLQSIGMWREACKAARASDASDWDEIRSDVRCLCATAFFTMVGSLLSSFLMTHFRSITVDLYDRSFQMILTLDLTFQTFSSLLLGGMIGPQKWSKSLDLFSCLAQSHGVGLAGTRIAFPGRINLSAEKCITSFPGKYADEWDRAVEVSKGKEFCSLACVFLTNEESGLGQHVKNPESPNDACYCKALYGNVPPACYVSEVDLTDPKNPVDQKQLADKKADAKAMNQLLLIKYSHTTRLEWKHMKDDAMRKAHERWQQNQGRAPWGCSWFQKWKEQVDDAVAKGQSLHVFYFEGLKGKGKVPWEELGDEETPK